MHHSKTLLAYLWQAALLVVLSCFAFHHNLHDLYITNDGATFVSLAHEQLSFFGKTLSLHTNMLEGLGNLSIGLNMAAEPAYWAHFYNPATGDYAPVFSYVFFSLLFFTAVKLIGWNYGFSRATSYVAAWLVTLLYYPYLMHYRIYPITGLIPNIAISFIVIALSDIAIWRMGRKGLLLDVAYTGLLCIALMLLLILAPVSIMLLIPYLAGSFLCACIASRGIAQSLRKSLAGVFIGLLSLALGWVSYELGLHFYTAVNFFTGDVHVGPLNRMDISILFQGRFFQRTQTDRTMGTWLFLTASAGALLLLYTRRGEDNRIIRLAAWQVVIFQLLLTVGGLFLMGRYDDWVFPMPVYFEELYFPLYALFAAYVIGAGARKLTQLPACATRWKPNYSPAAQALAVLLLAAYIHSVHKVEARQDIFNIPPISTAITDVLEKEIALYPPKPFAGRVVSLIPNEQFEDQFAHFLAMGKTSGNEHMTTGLWLKYIPTLVEYNQLVTPYSFWFTQKFLQSPGIGQRRNWTNFSHINLPALRLLGVRFIITPEPSIAQATQRAQLEIPEQSPLRLLEIEGANVKGISAQKTENAASLDAIKASLQANHFDASEAILTLDNKTYTELAGKQWSKASISLIRAEEGGWHITAQSDGWTMLVVPIEYSRCVHLTPQGVDMPQAVRVDAVLTGLIFRQKLDVLMETSVGIFNHPACRWQDYQDFKALQLAK